MLCLTFVQLNLYDERIFYNELTLKQEYKGVDTNLYLKLSYFGKSSLKSHPLLVMKQRSYKMRHR